jgi:hypothetical protein
MKYRGRFALVAAFLTVTIVVTVAAADQDAGIVNSEESARSDCQIGNLNPPAPDPVLDFFQGQESYAYHVYPPAQCDCPEGGFALESISMILYREVGVLPVNFSAAVQVFDAVPSRDRTCYVPGELLYQSEPTTISIGQTGFQTITVPAPDSPVFLFDYNYFIGIEFLDAFQIGLAVDDDDQECTAYVFRDQTWIDLFGRDRLGGGKLIIFGDIVCGEDPVATEQTTWGTLKSLYR